MRLLSLRIGYMYIHSYYMAQASILVMSCSLQIFLMNDMLKSACILPIGKVKE